MGDRAIGVGRFARRKWTAGLIVLVLGAVPTMAAHASVGSDAGFEDKDGNLAVASQMDWNGFAPAPAWTGTAPYRQRTGTVNGWAFTGLEDSTKANSDTGFSGGVKQDDNCPGVTGSSSSNKTDLKRAYVASKTVNGHVYLELAWVRIVQHTTSPSTHVGFEFNQGASACSTGGLVNRVAGDMLIVYDFAGSSTDIPTLTLRRWTTSGPCEVGTTVPCWGTATNLTASGYAEAKVNTSDVGSVSDSVAPTSETLGQNEFGEAGIDLTGAGAFPNSGCTAFGQVEAVSRSSGDSGSAAMEDLVGPGKVDIDNCLPATITSQQKVSISDVARPTGFGTPTGTVDFQLFRDSGCSTNPLPYDSGPVALVNGVASTDNAPNGKPPTLKLDGTYYWLVTYSGDANNESSTKCGVEQTTISGNTPGIDP